MSNQRAFLDELAKKLNVRTIDGWYSVATTAVVEHGGSGLITKYKSMKTLLQTVYPEYHLIGISLKLLICI